ncbi:MAG: DUF4384 domain-containing protein [Bryobacterales bacterium]|nr:DUF4384 domain-containing protein [Bryobacterales bacterium]
MILKKLVPAAVLAGAVLVVAQSKPELTARELFFVPAAVTAAKKSSTGAAKQTVAQAPKKTGEVIAKNTPKTRPQPQPAVEPQEIHTDTEVKLVSAGYTGPRPLGIRYSLLKRVTDGWMEVNADSTFQSGDAIRVQVEANEDGYLYIVARGSSGSWDVLFPNKDVRAGTNFIESGDAQILPSPKGLWRFDNKRGQERLFLVMARKPVGDLDKLIYDLNQAGKPAAAPAPAPAKPAAPVSQPKPSTPEPKDAPKRTMLATNIRPIDDQLVGRLRSQMVSRDLVFEKVDDSPSPTAAEKKESAVYVVEKSGKPDARLVVDITLKHD